MTKYVIGGAGWVDITPGKMYEVFEHPYGPDYIIDDVGDDREYIFCVWPIHQTGKSDAELLTEIAARNPDWNLPEAPNPRAGEIVEDWAKEWRDIPDSRRETFGLFIARKLLKEGVIK